MWVEALAAGLVGLALLTLVLSPLVAGQLPEPPLQDEPDELDETPRGAALLALKEIEFDQATGKLSDEDYAVLKSKYVVAGAPGQERRTEATASPRAPARDIGRYAEEGRVRASGGSVVPNCGRALRRFLLRCSRGLEESVRRSA
jgi:hypothetical protein